MRYVREESLRYYCHDFVSEALFAIEDCLEANGDYDLDYDYRCSHVDLVDNKYLDLGEAAQKCMEGMNQDPPDELYGMGGECVLYSLNGS